MPDSFSIPPVAPVKPVELRTHDDLRVDPYFWLRERDNQAVIDYLQAENEYAETIMADTAELQAQLYDEMRAAVKESDSTVPVQIDDYFYYERTEEGKQYPIHCRKHRSLEAAEEILLDLNALADGLDYLRLGNFVVSPDHRLLAYAMDTDGSEVFTLHIKDLESGELLSDQIGNTYYGLEWANDSRTLYYLTLDAAKRPDKLFRHQLGEDPAADALLYHESNETFELQMHKAKSKRYIFLIIHSHLTTEVHFLDADAPEAPLRIVQPRIYQMEYQVAHYVAENGNERFFILTNWDARNFRVMETPVSAPGREHWREFIAHREHVKLESMECFLGYLVVYEREHALRQIRVQNLHGGDAHRITFHEPVYTITPERNPDYRSSFLRYGYTSLVQAKTVYDYSMNGRYQILRKEQEVPGYKSGEFVSERLWATAPDGVKVPISLVHHKDIQLDGNNPTFLYGYGSYGFSMEPIFNSSRIALLKRGFVFAIAHIRGGSELGRQWYESGKFLHKKNTFTDFIACAEHLIGQNYTNPRKLVVMGRSAGGLLMAAVTNLRPDLFAGVIAGVPFVDVISTMLDPTIPLTVPEYEEWGNPSDPEYYAYMKSYSPYDNVEAKSYPPILATAGLNDPRVQYWEPAKWIAKLRAVKIDDNLLLLKTNMGAGHSGASGRFDYLKETAFEYAFLLKVLGMV